MDLTSHHVNYLIWRYLQESGHGEAAVMLQRAWNPNPQTLPFAPYIKTHALVSLVQKGLQYHEIEQSLDEDGNAVPLTPSKLFFGPAPLNQEILKSRDGHHGKTLDGLGSDQAPLSPGNKAVQEDNNTNTHTHTPTHININNTNINGHISAEAALPVLSVKKGRKGASSLEHPEGHVNGDDGAMDIDTNGIDHDRVSATPAIQSPSPAEGVVDADGDVGMSMGPPSEGQQDQEPATAAQPTYTLTTGRSVGVQITPAKAADLSPNTTLVDADVARADHVTRTLWRPFDSSVFASAGDSFCGLWKSSSPSSQLAFPVQEKLFDSRGDGTWVTALAWDPTGQKLAVATYNNFRGSITMYDVHGDAVDLLPEVPRMISGLHWASKGSHMVVVASDGKDSELALWDDTIRPEELPSPQVIEGPIYDLTWAGDNQVYASGNGLVVKCDVDSSIHTSKTFPSGRADTEWTYIRGGKGAPKAAVVAASSASASIWVPTHDINLEDAHRGDITAIELRPQPSFSDTSTSFIMASSSIDDTVKIWNVDLESKQISCIHTLFLTPGLPALALSFSPDGYAIGAASTDKLFIWNTERGGQPLATWTAPASNDIKGEGTEETTNGGSASADLLPYRSLAWDMDGKKLVMGFGTKMAIINMQR